jgi:hypothetical protein
MTVTSPEPLPGMQASLERMTEREQAALWREVRRQYNIPVHLTTAQLGEWLHDRRDLQAFAERCFPHLCTVPFSRMHREMFAYEYAQWGVRGRREAVAAPRGNAKTTLRGFIQIIHDCVYRSEPFILILSNTAQ